MMNEDFVIGVDIAVLSFDPNTLNQLATQMIAQGSEADAIAALTDLNGTIDDMVSRLTAMGGQDALVASGTSIENQAYDLVTNYDPTVGDPSMPSKAASLQTQAFAWQPQASAALRNAPAATTGQAGAPTIASILDATTGAASGAPGDSVTMNGTNFTGTTAVDFSGVPAQFQVISATQITATIPQGAFTGPVHVTNAAGTGVSAFTIAAANPYTDPNAYGGGSSGGGSGGGGGGGGGGLDDGGDSGDPGGIDWGDGSDSGGGGGGDDLGPSSSNADQGIDWGDAGQGDMIDEQRSTDTMSAPDNAQDPFASMLPADETDSTDQGDSENVDDHEEEVVGGSYLIGVDAVIGDTIPKAGATYDDHDTVLAVQTALKAHGFDPGTLDGVYGPNTKRAIEAMQSAAGIPSTGVIDSGVLIALKVTASSSGGSATPRSPSSAGGWFGARPASAAPAAAQGAQPTFWTSPVWAGAPVNRWQGSVGLLGLGALVTGVIAAIRK